MSAKNKKSSANRARNEALPAALKDTYCLCAQAPSPASGPTPPQLQQQLWMIHPAKVLHPQRMWLCPGRGTGSGLAMEWQSPAVHLGSPCSTLRGAEQSCFTLDICHATRASPLPIRPPTHLHPSPVQTLLAINKQWKCQPVSGKSPQTTASNSVGTGTAASGSPGAGKHQNGPGHGQAFHQPCCGPLASAWFVSPSCFQHYPST